MRLSAEISSVAIDNHYRLTAQPKNRLSAFSDWQACVAMTGFVALCC